MILNHLKNKVPINNFKLGDIVHGYKLEKVDKIKELNLKPYLFKHQATETEHLHIEKADDSNNVFGVLLRTTPEDSTGVAHILEHLALSGSEKYNVRDPFFKMLTRSLATFMNAMTGPDYTLYPFSTQNKKDYFNLMKIYVDAVFFPRLDYFNFRQEGWRLEHETCNDNKTPITIKGVVYNEMKGLFSSSTAIYSRKLMNHLFPNTTYQYESGGDPMNIPDLTHEGLKSFHSSCYHPSNAKFFTYGNFPLEESLKELNNIVLSKFENKPEYKLRSTIQDQPLWSEARSATIFCPNDKLAAHPDRQVTTSISYILPGHSSDNYTMFVLNILSTLLLSGPNAPFFKNLIESGLGADYSPSAGLANYTKQPYFSIGLQGIEQESVSKVHEIIEKTFCQAAKEGFAKERIDSILHSIELGLKHISGNFGLNLLFSLQPIWIYDGDVLSSMHVNDMIDKFKKNILEDENYLSDVIHNHFIQNNHKLLLTMKPDDNFEEERKKQEESLIKSRVENLSQDDRVTVYNEGVELLKRQNIKEDLNLLPCLVPSKDISKTLPYSTNLKFDNYQNVNVQICEQPTNEVVYFRALSNIDTKDYDPHLDDYLPLLCDVATKLGCGSYERRNFSQLTDLYTGGLSVGLHLNPHPAKLDSFKKEIIFGSYCLKKNIPKMFDLWAQVYQKINYDDDVDFLKQMIISSAEDLSKSIIHSGNFYASKRASSKLTKLAHMDERLSGLTYVTRIRDIAANEDIDEVILKLKYLSNIVFDPNNLKCAINCQSDAVDETMTELKSFIDQAQQSYYTLVPDANELPPLEYTPKKLDRKDLNFATHFVAKSLLTVPRLHHDFPKLAILSRLVTTKFLHKEVREKGGAYGAALRLSNNGILSFSSYRDPNTQKTLDTYKESENWVGDGTDFNENDIEESKLSVFQDVDKPVSPGRRGQMHFLLAETDAMRQNYRQRLLEVSKKDIMELSHKYLKNAYAETFII